MNCACAKIDLTKFMLTGISGQQLTVGQQSPTITCRSNIPVSYIEWRDRSSNVVTSATNQTVLEYNIPVVEQYVLDTLHGQPYTCEAVTTSDDGTNTTSTETVEIHVAGRYWKDCPVVV